ncbi:hypothetical protein [Paractinoplanes durhamensis]|uniref:hypothetical protein n=1 Tax=Paractinoplanes durhamensis TaxID=113563 RepID=UPI0036354FED
MVQLALLGVVQPLENTDDADRPPGQDPSIQPRPGDCRLCAWDSTTARSCWDATCSTPLMISMAYAPSSSWKTSSISDVVWVRFFCRR